MLNLRRQRLQMRTVQANNERTKSAPNEWAPAHTAFLLKLVLYASVGAGAWLLQCSDTECSALEANIDEPSSDDYSTWKPEQ